MHHEGARLPGRSAAGAGAAQRRDEAAGRRPASLAAADEKAAPVSRDGLEHRGWLDPYSATRAGAKTRAQRMTVPRSPS